MSTHQYYRSFDTSNRNSISVIDSKIAANSRVLDLGFGSGVLGKHLVSEKQCVVDGIDFNTESEHQQRSESLNDYRHLINADLETQALKTLVFEQYDVIVCADILEHLRAPQTLLDQLPDLLAADGRVIMSVPNVSHIGLLSDLIEGKFEYRSEGLLDATHVRFFTRYSLLELLTQAGYQVESFETIELDPRATEFKQQQPHCYAPKLFELLTSHQDALAYQFIVEAKPAAAKKTASNTQFLQDEARPIALSYAVQLYWRAEEEDYCYANSAIPILQFSQEAQQIKIELPVRDVAYHALRLDPSDRAGYVHIDSIRLLDDTGQQLWEWDQQAQSLLTPGRFEAIQCAKNTDEPGAVMLLSSAAANFHLPIPADILQTLTAGGTVLLSISSPMSADYQALVPRLNEIYRHQIEEVNVFHQRLLTSEQALAEAQQTIEQHNKAVEQDDDLLKARDHQIQERDHLLELQSEQLRAREALIDERDRWLQEKQDRAERQYQKIVELEELLKQIQPVAEDNTQALAEVEQAKDLLIQQRDEQITDYQYQLGALRQELVEQMSFSSWAKRPALLMKDWVFSKFR